MFFKVSHDTKASEEDLKKVNVVIFVLSPSPHSQTMLNLIQKKLQDRTVSLSLPLDLLNFKCIVL